MASVIESNMTICDKRIRVTADLREDGTVGIRIESDCDALKGFAENL